MPVYERGYTHWEPSDRKAWPAWLVIAKRGISEPLKRRWLLLLIIMAWVPAIVKGGIIYFKLKAGNLADLLGGGWASIEPEGFLSFIEGQRFSVFVLLAIIGSGLIASDRRDNGLSLYFSRPLGLASYVGGKMLVVLFYYCLVTLLPVLALCIFGYAIDPSATGFQVLVLTPIRAITYCLISGVSMSLVLLAFSSIGKRSIFVMVWWTIMVNGSESIGNIGEGLGARELQLVNFLGQYHNAGSFLFNSQARLGVSPLISILVIVAWTMFAILVLRSRIRTVEVVS